MSLVELLDNLLVRPLLLICNGLFDPLVRGVGPGYGLILLAVIVNALLLPLYYQMERSGRAARELRTTMDREIARIKGAFGGRERYFYIRTIHRHYGYRPLSAVLGAGDLLLQIAVFATVYRYLAGLPRLQGVGFAGIPDLGRPDGLLWGLNLLPLLMTAANVASVVAYVDVVDVSKRRQGFGLAALFLVLLYSSPSSLVIYWTSSNVFSLLKNLVAKNLGHRLPAHVMNRISRFASQE